MLIRNFRRFVIVFVHKDLRWRDGPALVHCTLKTMAMWLRSC
jgi:hypothetical protein